MDWFNFSVLLRRSASGEKMVLCLCLRCILSVDRNMHDNAPTCIALMQGRTQYA